MRKRTKILAMVAIYILLLVIGFTGGYVASDTKVVCDCEIDCPCPEAIEPECEIIEPVTPAQVCITQGATRECFSVLPGETFEVEKEVRPRASTTLGWSGDESLLAATTLNWHYRIKPGVATTYNYEDYVTQRDDDYNYPSRTPAPSKWHVFVTATVLW